MSRKITPLKDVLSVIKLYFFFKKEQPFIVHSHTPKAGIVSMLAAKLAGLPNRLHTVAGLPLMEATGCKRRILNIVEKLTYSCATKVYPNSKGLYDFIIENNFTVPKKLNIIANGSSNGIDTSKFKRSLFTEYENNVLKNKLGIRNDDIVFVFVGRLVKNKGINELVASFIKLSKLNIQNSKLLLVGSFENELDPLNEKTRNSIDQNTSIISVVWQQDVRPFFAISNVLVFPSYREGFPNVVMQAGAMNLPSIVTDINGCNEIVLEGKNGWIIPVKDEGAIFEKMKYCLENPNDVLRVAKDSRKLITSRYERKMVWEALLIEYKLLECEFNEKI
jgi:glycosyltransferase involved in cell wall biosynthesis